MGFDPELQGLVGHDHHGNKQDSRTQFHSNNLLRWTKIRVAMERPNFELLSYS
jgi:hypothetical protein